MGAAKTLWHLLFYSLLCERKPACFEVRAEVPLSAEPLRADFLLLRRQSEAATGEASVLRGLWPRISRDALVELKSASRPLRRGELAKLLGCAALYFASERDRFQRRQDLLIALVVAATTPTLLEEADLLGVQLGEAEDGYLPMNGLCFPGCVVLLDIVADNERDELLGLFGRDRPSSLDAVRWLHAHLWRGDEAMNMKVEQMEGYEDVLRKLVRGLPVEVRLDGLAAEERLAGLGPAERLAGLGPADLEALGAEIQKRLRG
jgi:hypothetical protein